MKANPLSVLPLFMAALLAFPSARATEEADYSAARQRLVETLAEEVADTRLYHDLRGLDPRVMAALSRVPRHRFIPERYRHEAYANRPVPIGYGQTISQPYIVAVMTALLQPQPEHVALEVGTGSGYQAAVLAELVAQVYSMEIIEPLGRRAADTLRESGYDRVRVRIGDGYYGWAEHGPYDLIIVTAAASHIPPPLLAQLKPGGRMVIPVGSRFLTQHLVLVSKDLKGGIQTREILPVLFVPLTGGH